MGRFDCGGRFVGFEVMGVFFFFLRKRGRLSWRVGFRVMMARRFWCFDFRGFSRRKDDVRRIRF